MPSTLELELVHIRRLLTDRKLSDPVIPGALLEELAYATMDEISREVGAGDIVQSAFATITPNTTTINVSATYPAMRHLKHLTRASDGVPLVKASYELITYNRQYGGGQWGPPRMFALLPAPDETVRLETYPTPETSEVLDAVWEPVPSAVTPIAGTIYLEPTGLLALRARVAAKALTSLSQEGLAKLGRGPEYISMLNTMADKAIGDEWFRMHQGELQDHIGRVARRG